MKSSVRGSLAGLCAVAAVLTTGPAAAQPAEIKEKPPMYTYVAEWVIPRARWADMDKQTTSTAKIFEKYLSSGTLVAYGDDTAVIHDADGPTHDGFWSSMSMAGLFAVLDDLAANPGTAGNAVLSSATKHWDRVYVSRFYNYRPGSWKGAYTFDAHYQLKADAPNGTLELLSKSLIVPLLEKLLADGTINEYEIDTLAIHNEAPGAFDVIYIAPKAEAIDKVNAAIVEANRTAPLGGAVFGSVTDGSHHRDELARTTATYK